MEQTWDPPQEFKDQLDELYGLKCFPRWGTPKHFRPDGSRVPSWGPMVCSVMEMLGTPALPWQRYVFDVALEVDDGEQIMWKHRDGLVKPTSVFFHREVRLSVPRQQGKTAGILGLSVWRLRQWAKQQILYAAQTRIHAKEKWQDDFVNVVQESELNEEFRIRASSGSEALIHGRNRSKMGITANTEKSGHGDVLDLGLIDEAFSHEDARLEQAMGPAMTTRHLAQKWILSAAGTERSYFWNGKRETGRQIIEDYWNTGRVSSVAYFEWFPPDGAPRNAFETWLMCMPALCPAPPCRCDPDGLWHHLTTERIIRAEYESMDADEFDRAYLNRTRRKTPPPDVNIPSKEWPTRADKKACTKHTVIMKATRSLYGSDVAFALDITPQRDHGSISAFMVREEDGLGQIELIAFRPGVDWMVEVIKRLRDLWNPVAIGLDAVTGSPTVTLLDKLLAAGFTKPEGSEKPKRGQLWIPTLHEYVSACGQMVDDIRRARLIHPDQKQMNVAVGGARTRPLGDAWALARRNALVNISPFVSATVARGAYFARIDSIVPDEGEPGVWRISGAEAEEDKQPITMSTVWRRPGSHLGRSGSGVARL